MKTIKFIFQEILKCLLFFVVIYIWLKFSLKSTSLIFLLSSIMTAAFEMISLFASKRNNQIKALKISQQQEAEDMFFSLLNLEDPVLFFNNLFKIRHNNTIRKKDYLIIYTGENKKILIYPFIKLQPFSADNLFEIIKKENNVSKIIIICNEYDLNYNKYLNTSSTEIVMLNKYQTYSAIYSEYEYFPEITTKSYAKSKISLKEFFRNAFEKSKTKGYILAGLFILFSSFYVKFSLYYKIAASLLFIFALISLFIPRSTIKKELL